MLSCAGLVSTAGRCVNRGFLRFERVISRRLDRATQALGPVFVATAVVLIGLSAFAYFEAVYPERFLRRDVPWWSTALGTAWSCYVVLMFSFHYYLAIATPPGSPVGPSAIATYKQLPLGRLAPVSHDSAPAASSRSRGTGESTRSERYARTCKKCPPLPTGNRSPKPERTHHCSVCQTCVLKFDHHCPWIKGCVGLHNERSFVLFLVYFSIACLFAAWWGFDPAMNADLHPQWNYRTPRLIMLLVEVLASIMGLAVTVMTLSQLLLVIRAQTNVEASDNSWYRKVAESRGRKYLNPYDLGWRDNLGEFFNVGGARDGRYHWAALLLPVALPAASDGWTWRKRPHWQRYSIDAEDELTDEEQASEGEDFDH
ncbi:zf-DHHC-domain-containing protein [Rhodotorula sp. JG-1b]|nr:zf-DHHC-domain-containing protein [Rhodotorula sp. JG-1b]